jgi:Holliday junction resolvase RusA-like endonuclease
MTPERAVRSVEIRVVGLPAPQGSKRLIGHTKAGRGILVESSARVKPWREAVKYAVLEAFNPGGYPRECCINGPVDVEMIFTLPKPRSAPRRRRTWPDKKPDVDKICRSTADALVEAGAIEDDARIVRLLAEKVFPGEHPDALGVPGAVIRIRESL